MVQGIGGAGAEGALEGEAQGAALVQQVRAGRRPRPTDATGHGLAGPTVVPAGAGHRSPPRVWSASAMTTDGQAARPAYKRVLLKISGEALMGDQHFGIDVSMVDQIASDIAEARALGVEVGVVAGATNDTSLVFTVVVCSW